MSLAVALLAAGSSRRMRGCDKLLEKVGGQPLLRRIAEQALAAAAGPVAVTLPPDDTARGAVLAGLPVVRLSVPDAAEGLSASLRAAARWARMVGADGLMICPADMPELTADDFATVAEAFVACGCPVRATDADGTPGHPVVFPAAMLREFRSLSGDSGARHLLCSCSPYLVALPRSHATTDLDTPEEWQDWLRASSGRSST